MKSFEKFTNLYELSKTLRFELKPVGETQQMLEDNQVFQKDEIIQKKYKQTKVYFDRLHREFVAEALKDISLSNIQEYTEVLKNVKKITKETDKKQRDQWEKDFVNEEKRLRKEVVGLFNIQAKKWSEEYLGLKNNDLKILDEKAVFSELLKIRYGEEAETLISIEFTNKETGEVTEEIVSIFDEWKGFTGYFTKFFETRKNFYKDDGTSTALATRIIDQNLRRFTENIEIVSFIERNYPDFSFDPVIEEYKFSIEEIRSLDFYASQCLLQPGIDDYNKEFVGKMKYAINHYRQANKGAKVPYLKTLDKQILSEKEKFIDEIEDDVRLKSVLEELLQAGAKKAGILKTLLSRFINLSEDFDLSKIYWSKKGFETISRRWTYKTNEWAEVLAKVFKGEERKTLKKNEGGEISFPDFIPLEYLRKSLDKIDMEEGFWKEKYQENINLQEDVWSQFLQIFKIEFSELFEKTIQTDKGEKTIGYDVSSENLKILLTQEKLEKTPEMKIIVKDYADGLLSVYQFSKYFAVEKSKKWDDSVDIDGNFYSLFKDEFYHDTFETIIQPYNLLRNYLTKKPWEEVQKWKLNFDLPTLSNGWDKNKESANASVILCKDGKYFLALMKKGNTHLFDDKNKEKFAGNGYEKMVYKLLPGANKMLPKVFFSVSNINSFTPSEKVLEIRNHSSHTKSGQPQKGYEKKDFSLSDCHILIDFFKESLQKHKDWKGFNFQFSKTSSYQDISDFYREVEQGGYKISWENISEKYIKEKNEKGELYLFQIKNKDWNEGSTGAKNLHTLYFENLFSQENFNQNFIFKLNGQAEIFYRPKAINEVKVKRNFSREIIEKKRYTEDKVFFHVPLTLNRGTGKPFSFNQQINELLANNPDINIIGVDRGEKHLAYYSVINQQSEILDSGTLNAINGVDYHEKLEEKAKKREQERKDWQAVEGIKDLKKGYISQVVRKLADLAIKYNAIIVFEDLNMRFKQIRGGIEKSIYQQLEKALIDKLNFLVNKGEKDPEKAGNLLKAYQLAAPFTTFKEMGKQTGIIFYTQASYTSKIDPITGWRPNLYLKKGSAKVNKENILKFSNIQYTNEGIFEFTYNIKNFKDLKDSPKNTKWIVSSCVERFHWNRKLNNNKGDYDCYKDLTDNFKKLFESVSINIEKSIKEQIENLETKGNEKFFSDFIFLFGLVCQIRNTDPKKEGDDNDFILSPVKPFFDSRNNNDKNLPKNGDDNGAYNIARKGIITLQKINEWFTENEKLKKDDKKEKNYPDLFISNTDWDNFTQK